MSTCTQRSFPDNKIVSWITLGFADSIVVLGKPCIFVLDNRENVEKKLSVVVHGVLQINLSAELWEGCLALSVVSNDRNDGPRVVDFFFYSDYKEMKSLGGMCRIYNL